MTSTRSQNFTALVLPGSKRTGPFISKELQWPNHKHRVEKETSWDSLKPNFRQCEQAGDFWELNAMDTSVQHVPIRNGWLSGSNGLSSSTGLPINGGWSWRGWAGVDTDYRLGICQSVVLPMQKRHNHHLEAQLQSSKDRTDV